MLQLTIHLSAPKGLAFHKKLLYYLRPKKYDINIPTNWKELSEAATQRLFEQRTRGEQSYKQQLDLLLTIMDIPKRIYLRIKPDDFTERLLPLLDWMSETPMTATPIREFTINDKLYAMPSSQIRYMTLKDFALCETYYERAMLGTEESDVYRFLAAVLRPYAPLDLHQATGIVRIPNSERHIEEHKAAMQSLPAWAQLYVLTFWTDCRAYLQKQYPEAFEEGNGESKEDMDWENLFTDLAEQQIFGNLREVENLNVHRFYKWLARKRKQQKQEQKKAFLEMMQQQHNQAFA